MRMRRYGTLSLALLPVYIYTADAITDTKKYSSIPSLKNMTLRVVGMNYYMNRMSDNNRDIPQGILDQIRLYASRLRAKEIEIFQEHRRLVSRKAIRAIEPCGNDTVLVANADNDVIHVTIKQDALIEKPLFCANDTLRKKQINSLVSLTSEAIAVSTDKVDIWGKKKDAWKKIKTLGLHIYKGDVSCMHVNDDIIITNDEGDSSIHIWKSVLGDTQHIMLTSHKGPINCFLIKDAQTFFSGSRDGTIREWKKRANGIWYEQAKIGWLDAVYNTHIPASTSRGIREINYRTRDLSRIIEDYKKNHSPLPDGHTDSIVALASLSDSNIISSSRDGSVRMWQFDDRGRWTAMHKEQKLQVTNMHVCAQRYIIATDSDGKVVLWDKDAEQFIDVMRSAPSIRLHNFVPLEDDKLLATGFGETICMWDLGLRKRLSEDQYQLVVAVLSIEKDAITPAKNRDLIQTITQLFHAYPDTRPQQEIVHRKDKRSKKQESESLALLAKAQHDARIGQILAHYIND